MLPFAVILATTKLLENCYKNFLILEAQNRIGGRVHSSIRKNNVDLCPQWCEGQTGIVFYELKIKDFDYGNITVAVSNICLLDVR